MAWSVTRVKDKANSPLYKEFLCDTVADISSLPTNQDIGKPYSEVNHKDVCSAGSIALVAATSDVYILTNAGQWVKL